jgi:hypothetical protein
MLRVEICVRISHGYGDSRMSEQLLHCHYVHPSIHQARSERVTQRMSRHAVDSRLSTCPSKARLQIDKRFSGLEIVENEFALPAERPSLKDLASLRVDRNSPGLLRLGCKDIQNALFEIHVGPAEGKNLSSPQPRIQSESNRVLNVGCRIPEKLPLLVRIHNPHAYLLLLVLGNRRQRVDDFVPQTKERFLEEVAAFPRPGVVEFVLDRETELPDDFKPAIAMLESPSTYKSVTLESRSPDTRLGIAVRVCASGRYSWLISAENGFAKAAALESMQDGLRFVSDEQFALKRFLSRFALD